MSYRTSQSEYESLTPTEAALGGAYGAAGFRPNEGSTPLNRYGPPSPTATSLCDVPSVTMRRIVVGMGLLWIGGVAYLSSLGGKVLREMEEQRNTNLAAMAGRRMHPTERLTPAMGSSSIGVDTGNHDQRGGLDSSYLDTISSDAMGTYSSGGSTASSGTSSSYAKGPLNHQSSSTLSRSAEDVTIMVVYGPEYHSYIWLLAWQVALGVNSAFKKHARAVTGRVVFGTTANLTFADVQNADAVLIGSPVYNGNTHPDVQTWINYWHIESDLSRKIGGAFVTAGGMHSGAEGTLMSLMRSMMVFRMMTIGGDSWDSPFGAAATVYEDPFGDTRRSHDFSSKCYQTDSLVHPHFMRKAWDLGERVANVTFALKNSTLWNKWGG